MKMPKTRKQFEIELALAFSAGVDSVLKGKVSSEYEGFKKFVKDNEFQCTSEELRPYLTTRKQTNVGNDKDKKALKLK